MPRLETLIKSDNICELLDEKKLGLIGQRVVDDYATDKESMDDWLERNEKAFEIIDHKFEGKSEPWDNAANAKIPLILGSSIKFQSEAGAEIIRGDELVKSEIFGKETEEKYLRSERVKAHMNYQIFHEMENWDGDMDQLLMCLPLIGCIHKKIYFDHITGQNVSELCLGNIFINQEASSPKKARITQLFERDKNAIYEHEVQGLWKKIEYTATDEEPEEDGIQEFVEQNRRLDLDEDGYEEPYIVTVHEKTAQVVRIKANYRIDNIDFVGKKVARISPLCHFIKYGFVPAPDGTYWSYGWGLLLGPLSDNVNTVVNQLLDAGTLSNQQGGWISSNVRSVKGDTRFKPGEYKTVKVSGGVLKDSIVNLPVKEPSNTMFALLELLMDTAKDFTSVTDVVAGDAPHANMAEGSILALIEQGKKTFNAIYKRIYRSMKLEFKKLFELNAIYTDPGFYAAFFDEELDPRADYDFSGYDIIPTANPEFASKTQRIVEAQALMAVKDDPRVNGTMVLRRYVQGVVDNAEIAAEMVPDEPNLTPQQVSEQMELAKQEMMDSNEVRTKELDAEITALKLEIAKIDLAKVQAEAPEKAAMAAEKTDAAALDKEGKRLENIRKETEIRLVETKIDESKSNQQANEQATKVLSGSS